MFKWLNDIVDIVKATDKIADSITKTVSQTEENNEKLKIRENK